MLRTEHIRGRTTASRFVARAALLATLANFGCAQNGGWSWFRRPAKSTVSDSGSTAKAPAENSSSNANEREGNTSGSRGSAPARAARPKHAATEAPAASRRAQTAATAAPSDGRSPIASGSVTVPIAPKADPVVATTPLVLSATGDSSGTRNRDAIAEHLLALQRSFHTIEGAELSANDATRREMVRKLLQSAQKAFDQGDLAEANGLAAKISVMLAPLVAGSPRFDSAP